MFALLTSSTRCTSSPPSSPAKCVSVETNSRHSTATDAYSSNDMDWYLFSSLAVAILASSVVRLPEVVLKDKFRWEVGVGATPEIEAGISYVKADARRLGASNLSWRFMVTRRLL